MTTTVDDSLLASLGDGGSPTVMLTTQESPTSSEERFWEETVAKYVYAVPSIVLMIFGTVGNSLSFAVFNSPSTRHSVTSVYFRVLAVTDTVVLYSGGIVFFAIGAFDFDVRTLSTFSCKFWIPVLLVFCYYSCWVLVFIAVDRFIGVWMPHRYRQLCSRKLAIIYILVLLLVISGTIGVFWALALDVNGDTCAITEHYQDFFNSVFVYLDLAMLKVVPTVILVVLNVLIIVQISRAAIVRQKSSSASAKKTGSSATAILLSVSLVYILCTIPSSTAFLATRAFGGTAHGRAQAVLYARSCETLYLANHSVNFVLYCVNGSSFRRELRRIFGMKVKPASSLGYDTTTTSTAATTSTTGSSAGQK